MVTDRVTDGRRIAQLLASELRGRTDGPLGRVEVADVRDVEGTTDGAFAYGIDIAEGDNDTRRLADVYVHEQRARLEVRDRPGGAARAGEEAGLRVRPAGGGSGPPRALVFVESGVEAKRAVDAVASLLEDLEG